MNWRIKCSWLVVWHPSWRSLMEDEQVIKSAFQGSTISMACFILLPPKGATLLIVKVVMRAAFTIL